MNEHSNNEENKDISASNSNNNKVKTEQADDTDLKKYRDRKIKKFKIFYINFILLMFGMFVTGLGLIKVSILGLISEYPTAIIGLFTLIFGLYWRQAFLLKHSEPNKVTDFTDVDDKYQEIEKKGYSTYQDGFRNGIEAAIELEARRTKKENILFETNSPPFQFDAEDPVERQTETNDEVKRVLSATIRSLGNKAALADEKASLLLQRGIRLTVFGIVYYLFSIIIWQVVFWLHGYSKEHLYGIMSCSFLFLFIEFLSAWFLKQYKNFTDNSVYLLKIKSMFDRFLIIYCIEKIENAERQHDKVSFKNSIDMLSKDFIWPDTTVIESKEHSFASETLSSLTALVTALKPNDKDKKKETNGAEE